MPAYAPLLTLRLFQDAADARSVSVAARRHGLTQSAASQRISQLERALGVVLLDRTVRPVGLTEAGRVYRDELAELLEKYDRLERRVRRMGHAAKPAQGRVPVVAIYSAGIDLMAQQRDAFERQHPGAEVSLDYDRPEAVVRRVASGQSELGVVSYPERWDACASGGPLVVTPLREEAMAVVCRPNHRLARERRVHARHLDRLAMLAFEAELPAGRDTAEYLARHEARPTIAHRFDNLDTLKGAVAVTDRFAILPRRCVRREVESGALAEVALTPALHRSIALVHRRGQLSDAGRALVEHLQAKAGPASEPAPLDGEPAPSRPTNPTSTAAPLSGAPT